MRTSIVLFILSCVASFAAESVISNSPDKRFRIVIGFESGSPFAIRDDTAAAAIVATGDDFTFVGAYSFSGTEAQWSPDSQMVFIHVTRMFRSGDGDAYAVLRWNGKGFTEVTLPDDATPIRWADNNRLVCTVRTEATLKLGTDKKAFARIPATAPKSK